MPLAESPPACACRPPRPGRCGARRELCAGTRRNPGPDWRIGLRQVAHRHGAHGLLPESAEVSAASALTGRNWWVPATRRCLKLRGHRIGMVFQEPMTALNPVHTIGRQVAEPCWLHLGLDKTTARRRAIACWTAWAFPRQRSALMPTPPVLRRAAPAHHHCHGAGLRARPVDCRRTHHGAGCDHPAADPRPHQRPGGRAQHGAHPHLARPGVISQNVDRMLVMYGGSVVESGPTASVFAAMAHPYTRGLLAARPQLAPEQRSQCGYRPLQARCPSWWTCPLAARLPGGAPSPHRPATTRPGPRWSPRMPMATTWCAACAPNHGARRKPCPRCRGALPAHSRS